MSRRAVRHWFLGYTLAVVALIGGAQSELVLACGNENCDTCESNFCMCDDEVLAQVYCGMCQSHIADFIVSVPYRHPDAEPESCLVECPENYYTFCASIGA